MSDAFKTDENQETVSAETKKLPSQDIDDMFAEIDGVAATSEVKEIVKEEEDLGLQKDVGEEMV